MKIKEMRQIVDLLHEEWDLGRRASKAKGKTCAWIYLFEILENSEDLVIKKEADKLIGICGYTKWDSNKHLIRKKFFGTLRKLLIQSPYIKNRKAIYKYYQDYDYLPEEMNDYFDGEISILIVDKKYRGKSYGKEILLKTFELAKKDNMKNLQILTDESCNVNFYERIGCKKVYETVIEYGESNKDKNVSQEIGYIYEFKFI